MSAAQYFDTVKGHLATYDREWSLDRIDLLNTAHEKTGQPRIYILLGAVAIGFILISATLGLGFVSNVFAFYPLYQSFKAIRSQNPSEDQFWLSYWVVYGTFALFESLTGGVFFWLPLYYILKIVFLVWCFHPSSRGALVVYQRVLQPLFAQVEAKLEEVETKPPGGLGVKEAKQQQRGSSSQKGR